MADASIESAELISRLAALRARVRRRLIAYGVFAVVGGGAVAFLTIVTLDWLLWLPPALRALGSILFVAGAFGATAYWIAKPLRAQLDIEEIASRLERHFVPLRDRLSSSVNFLRGAPGASPELVREVISDTERMVRDMPLESAISIEPLAVRGSICGVSMVVLMVLLILFPQWVRTGVARYAGPWGPAEWPRRVAIVPITADLAVPIGESATVAMRIDRGWRDSLRGVVHLRSGDGTVQRLTMRPEPDGNFSATLDAVSEDLTYWFQAGDDNTGRQPGRITVVQRPEVVEALATIAPPAYAADRPPRIEDLGQGAVTAVVGSSVRVSIRASKAVSGSGTSIGLQLEDGSVLPLDSSHAAPEQVIAQLTVTGDVSLRAQLRDEHGFTNRGQALYRIRARPDSPPAVLLVRPSSLLEVTPRARVEVEVRVDDDFGIESLELQASAAGRSNPETTSLDSNLRLESTPDGVEGFAKYIWSLETLRLAPGELLTYEAVARDSFSDGHMDGQIGRSNSQQIRIISETEFELRLREDMAALESRIRQAAIEQDELRDRTDTIARSIQPAGLNEMEKAMAASLAGGQSRLVRSVRDISVKFDHLAERMAQNQAGDAESRKRMTDAAESLRRIAGEPMTSAEALLASVREQGEAGAQIHNVRQAVVEQSTAAEELRGMLRSVSQWSTFQGLVSKTRDLLDRQLRIQQETMQVGRSTLGKSTDSLTPEENEALGRARRQQEQLAADLEQHLARMRELSEASRGKQPAASDAMDSAIRSARANQLDKRMQAASEAIGENRTAAANVEQRAAADAIRQMVSALRERERRELEELRKKIAGAEEQVSWLIEHQRSLLSATNEAGLVRAQAETFATLEQEQRTLAKNALITGEELLEVQDAGAAGRMVRDAADPMDKSALRLAQSLAEPSASFQQQAIDTLQRALALLSEASRKADEQALRQSLEQIRDRLEEILAAQLEINEGVAKLEEALRGRSVISRAEARQASKLAQEQDRARSMVSDSLADLQKVPVYEWSLQRAAGWMEESRGALENRRIDSALRATTERISQELQKLIAALVDTLAMPFDQEFAEAEDAAGGSGGMTAGGPPIPTIAELLVLKTMQSDINSRTKQVAEQIGDTATESDLQHLAVIAQDQAEVRRLTELVIQRAAHPE